MSGPSTLKKSDNASKTNSKTNTVSSFKADEKSSSGKRNKKVIDMKNCSPFPELQEVNESHQSHNGSSGYNLTISHVLTEEKAFSGEISSMMNTVSEDKSPIDLKNSI